MAKKEISSQNQFQAVARNFKYSEYRNFNKAYRFNPLCRLKRTALDMDQAFPGKMTKRKKIMASMKTGLTVTLMNKKAKLISENAEPNADIFMALKKGLVILEKPKKHV